MKNIWSFSISSTENIKKGRIMASNISFAIETITPEIAKKYLALNVTNNRKLILSNISKIKNDMESGNFLTTHQGIAFDSDGNLHDGQNRMKALSECPEGTSIEILVARNVPKEAFHVTDSGKSRSEDFRMSLLCDSPVYKSKLGISIANAIIELYGKYPKNYSIDDKKRFIDEHYGLQIFAYRIGVRNVKGISSVSYLTALLAAYACKVPLSTIEIFDNCANRSEILPTKNLNWKAPIELAKWYSGLVSRSGQTGREIIFNQTQKQLYLFETNTKRTNKNSFYIPSEFQLEQANLELNKIFERK